ncbi:cytochrome P450 [Amycolatopsis sp. NPDC051071]|uniref:cytochrome P450 n=1 Tax=Amycolatopsis sp. NPDC051071 TaxID=3154637 RepID=UPI00343ACC07
MSVLDVPRSELPPFDHRSLGQEEIIRPYPLYRRYLAEEPVHWSSASGAWFVFGHQPTMEVLGNPDFTRGGLVFPPGCDALTRLVRDWLVFLDPPRHTRLRSALAGRFTRAAVRSLRPQVQRVADDLVAALAGRPEIDLVADFATRLPLHVMCDLLGLPAADREWLHRRALVFQEASSTRQGDYAAAEEAARDLGDYFRQAAADPAEDGLLAPLVRAGCTPDEVAGTGVHLLTAGHETTAHLIGKSVLALLDHPGVLRSRPVFTADHVDELIRYDGPVQMVSRRAGRDAMLLGSRRVRAGDKVVLMLGAANRDPDRFEQPDELRLDRAPRRHCGFGYGAHRCLGAALAGLEAQLALTTLVRSLPAPHAAGRPVRYHHDLIFHGPRALPLRTGWPG